jgi:hypothetical protein
VVVCIDDEDNGSGGLIKSIHRVYSLVLVDFVVFVEIVRGGSFGGALIKCLLAHQFDAMEEAL